MCVWWPEADVCPLSLYCTLSYFGRKKLSLNLEFTNSAELAGH